MGLLMHACMHDRVKPAPPSRSADHLDLEKLERT